MVGVSAPAQALWQRNIEADFGRFNGGAPGFHSAARKSRFVLGAHAAEACCARP
jgi:hypothetical protein